MPVTLPVVPAVGRPTIAFSLPVDERDQTREPGDLQGNLAENGLAREWAARLQLKFHRLEDSVGTLSGGNQQKVVIAREIQRDPKLLIAAQPTRGVDIGAIEFIHRSLVQMRDAGCAVLLVSVELDEIMSLADRILVMFDGAITGEVPGHVADERRLGLLMAGITEDRAA